MVSGLIRNQMPRKGLRVRIPCPPLSTFRFPLNIGTSQYPSKIGTNGAKRNNPRRAKDKERDSIRQFCAKPHWVQAGHK